MDVHFFSKPNPDEPETTNHKHQRLNKFQNTMSKLQINSKLQAPNPNKTKRQLFGISNFGHCDLFVIWKLAVVF